MFAFCPSTSTSHSQVFRAVLGACSTRALCPRVSLCRQAALWILVPTGDFPPTFPPVATPALQPASLVLAPDAPGCAISRGVLATLMRSRAACLAVGGRRRPRPHGRPKQDLVPRSGFSGRAVGRPASSLKQLANADTWGPKSGGGGRPPRDGGIPGGQRQARRDLI